MNRTREDRERENPGGETPRRQPRVKSLMRRSVDTRILQIRGVQYLDESDEEESPAAAAVEARNFRRPLSTLNLLMNNNNEDNLKLNVSEKRKRGEIFGGEENLFSINEDENIVRTCEIYKVK